VLCSADQRQNYTKEKYKTRVKENSNKVPIHPHLHNILTYHQQTSANGTYTKAKYCAKPTEQIADEVLIKKDYTMLLLASLTLPAQSCGPFSISRRINK
jgi:hypothetical protein